MFKQINRSNKLNRNCKKGKKEKSSCQSFSILLPWLKEALKSATLLTKVPITTLANFTIFFSEKLFYDRAK